MATAILQDMKASSVKDQSHDAATYVISSYLRNPDYQIRNGNFRARMIKECLKVVQQDGVGPSGYLKERPITKARRAEVSYETIYDNEIALARAESDDALNILSSRTPVVLGGGVATMPVANFLYAGREDGQLLDGLTSFFTYFKWYRPAIRKLVTFVGKQFLLDHAVEVKRIFREARRDSSNKPTARRGTETKSKIGD